MQVAAEVNEEEPIKPVIGKEPCHECLGAQHCPIYAARTLAPQSRILPPQF